MHFILLVLFLAIAPVSQAEILFQGKPLAPGVENHLRSLVATLLPETSGTSHDVALQDSIIQNMFDAAPDLWSPVFGPEIGNLYQSKDIPRLLVLWLFYHGTSTKAVAQRFSLDRFSVDALSLRVFFDLITDQSKAWPTSEEPLQKALLNHFINFSAQRNAGLGVIVSENLWQIFERLERAHLSLGTSEKIQRLLSLSMDRSGANGTIPLEWALPTLSRLKAVGVTSRDLFGFRHRVEASLREALEHREIHESFGTGAVAIRWLALITD